MKTLIPIFIAAFAFTASAQRSVDELLPAHAAALESYMSANKALVFRQEYNLDDEYLKWLRESFGNGFKPSYAVGDFNHDKIKDFAVLLYRENEPTELSPADHPQQALRLVVFNGSDKGFRVAYTRDLTGPAEAFINFEKDLYYGVFETDAETFILKPAGRGYILEFEKAP